MLRKEKEEQFGPKSLISARAKRKIDELLLDRITKPSNTKSVEEIEKEEIQKYYKVH